MGLNALTVWSTGIAEAVSKERKEFYNSIYQNDAFYNKLKSISQQNSLTVDQKWIIETLLKKFSITGAGICSSDDNAYWEIHNNEYVNTYLFSSYIDFLNKHPSFIPASKEDLNFLFNSGKLYTPYPPGSEFEGYFQF